MPDLEISRLPQLAGADLQGTDPIAVADISASETKKLTVADLLTFGVTFIGSNSISGDQIISLDGGKLLPDSVTAREIAPDAVGSSELADSSVGTAAIQDGAVTDVKLASGIDGSKILALSIGNAQIIDLDGSKILTGTISTDQLGADCITAVQLANNSVDTAAVQNGAITNDKLAVNIDGSKILANSITSLELAPNSVGSLELSDASVDTAAIQNGAVTDEKLASGIDGAKLTDSTVSSDKIISLDGAKILANSIGTLQLEANSVTSAELAPNSVGASELADLSVDTADIQDAAVTDVKLASGISGAKITDGTVTDAKITSLDGAKITDDSITNAKLASGIDGAKLTDSTVASDKLISLDGAKITDGSITDVKLASGIDGAKLTDSTVSDAKIIGLDGAKITDGSITDVKLGSGIDGAKLADATVSDAQIIGLDGAKVFAGSIDTAQLKADSVTSTELALNSVGSSQLADASVDTNAVQNSAITDAKLASGISGSKITDGSLSDGKISSLDGAKLFGNSVTANEIAPSSIGSSELSDASVDTVAVQNGAITDAKLASGIDGGKISSASITNVQLGPGSVTNPAISDGAVTDAKITGPIDASKLSSGSIPDTALSNVTDRGLDQSTGKIGIANTVTAGTQSGISWDEQGLITAASGSVPSGDLPVATDVTPGVVSVPSGGGLAVDATGALSIANAVTAATKQGIKYDKHGSIVSVSDTIPVASIPLATNSTIGGVKVPGPDVIVSSDGTLTLGEPGVLAGTYPKVTVNSRGIVTAGTSLTASDIPELDADKITSGTLDGSFIADRSVQQIKLADNSTCYIQETRPNVDPTANYKGCLWYQESTAQLRIWNGNSWNAVGFGRLSQDNLRWGGIVNATTGLVGTLTDAGQNAQLTVGAALPTASDALGGLYMVTDPGGNGIGVTPGITYDAGDWVLCINAAEGWTRIDTMSSGGGGGGAGSLDALTDVTITAPANGEILVYDDSTGQWENEPQAVESVSSVFGRTGDVVAVDGDYDLGELGDVDLTSVPAASGDVLQYDGAEWTPINLAGTVPVTSVGAGAGLTDSGSGTDVILNVGSGTGITVNADDVEINRTVVDSWYVEVSGDTMTGPLVLSGDPTTSPQAANKKYVDDVAAAAVISSDAKYVEVAGDNMTGDLTLGTDKITLNATGLATFADDVTSGTGSYSTGDNAALHSLGSVSASRTGTNVVWAGYTTGNSVATSAISAAGSAQFADEVLIGGTLPSAPNISLNADGSGDFAGDVKSLGFLYASDTAVNTRVGIGYSASPAGASAGQRIIGDESHLYYYPRLNGDTDHRFFTSQSGVAVENLRIQGSTGDVLIGGTLPASPNISLNGNGSAALAGSVSIGGDIAADGVYTGAVTAMAALAIDCSSSNYFTKTINANSTFTFTNVPAARAFSCTLELTHTSGTVTWPASVKFPDNTAPSLTTGKTHLFMFVTDDGGATFRGASLIDYTN